MYIYMFVAPVVSMFFFCETENKYPGFVIYPISFCHLLYKDVFHYISAAVMLSNPGVKAWWALVSSKEC